MKAMAGGRFAAAGSRCARYALAAGLLLAVALACGDQAPATPGTFTVEVTSPNGDEGAARVSLAGGGVRSVSAIDGWVYDQLADTLATVLVVNDAPGPLRFRVEVADTAVALQGTVVEVAGPDDALRASLAGYSVRVVR